jgi:hypothetical protein
VSFWAQLSGSWLVVQFQNDSSDVILSPAVAGRGTIRRPTPLMPSTGAPAHQPGFARPGRTLAHSPRDPEIHIAAQIPRRSRPHRFRSRPRSPVRSPVEERPFKGRVRDRPLHRGFRVFPAAKRRKKCSPRRKPVGEQKWETSKPRRGGRLVVTTLYSPRGPHREVSSKPSSDALIRIIPINYPYASPHDPETHIAGQTPRRSRHHHRPRSRSRRDHRRHVRITDHTKLRSRNAIECHAGCAGQALAGILSVMGILQQLTIAKYHLEREWKWQFRARSVSL